MNTTPSTELRLATLERSLHRTRLSLLAVLAIGAVGVLLGVSTQPETDIPDLIQVRAFEVVDESGTVVVSLSSDDYGGLVVTYNSDGKIATDINIGLDGEGAVSVYNGTGKGKLDGMRARMSGDGYISVYNTVGKSVVYLMADKKSGDGTIMVSNHQAKTLI